MTDQLRVTTMNVLDLRQADGPHRRDVIREGIRALQPDLVALQEVGSEAGIDDVEDLLGGGWHIAAHPRWGEDGVGAALASRWPVGEVRSDDLQVTERTKQTPWCGVVVAEIHAPGPLGTFVVAHHKPSWPYGCERERELQAVECARLVEGFARDGQHVVLLGDFDAEPESASIRFWTGRQSLEGVSVAYRDAWDALHPGEPGHTFSPGDNVLAAEGQSEVEPPRRIDYVMVRCDSDGPPTLRVTDCRRVFVEPVAGTQASDHYGVFAELTLPPRTRRSGPAAHSFSGRSAGAA
ncbi:Metal-dependent hydrolase, endonuclease/exonuclease/phosphatase family [Streptomyces sp. WMMB 714]|uniref:endonuclease/exonuclease/phosphatase family protein n=1 Tax=Streptomyces sp. WMMB 714 TaxID=1286822 RepID=UPI0005F788E7|nr:endonuclease/exonuclease/phosphatase family protein [Streptomyces sp. WMMB 714]SCK25654.1 Metal-dependent hydrolase, endonuclease/exonuclease/phosphatase family [Streptomyces sp. WMMB 714]